MDQSYLQLLERIVIICAAIAMGGCAGSRGSALQKQRTEPDMHVQLVQRIHNSDVNFDGTYFGLMERIEGPASCEVLKADAPAVPALLEALHDRERYIAAHVLLTYIVDREWRLSASNWNGLKVDLLANGSIVFDPADQEVLRERWAVRVIEWQMEQDRGNRK